MVLMAEPDEVNLSTFSDVLLSGHAQLACTCRVYMHVNVEISQLLL